MNNSPRIGIVLASTRTQRFADVPADWVLGLGGKRTEAVFERIDLRDYPMPFFNEEKSPFREPPKNEVALRWARKVAEVDGFVFVTGEYNHSIPAVLKNALDHVYVEFNKKPATFVGYGGAGGVRAIEQLRLVLVELQMAPLRNAVHIFRDDYMALATRKKTFADFPHYDQSANLMLDELVWWTQALRVAREATMRPS